LPIGTPMMPWLLFFSPVTMNRMTAYAFRVYLLISCFLFFDESAADELHATRLYLTSSCCGTGTAALTRYQSKPAPHIPPVR
jgi:hypothetical protein